jgi:Lon protease-like protein
MMKKKIPIFPLNLVIFPESKYPLHIFEERYKLMIDKCINFKEDFGIVSKIDSEISSIGCTVEVVTLIKKYENGSMDILVKGKERFRIISTSLHKFGFLVAEIETYNDDSPPFPDKSKYEKALHKFNIILDKTDIQIEESFWSNLNETDLKAFKLAEKSGLNLKQQQNLLAYKNEDERINYLIDHYNKVEFYLEKSEAMRDIIAGDGYINEV